MSCPTPAVPRRTKKLYVSPGLRFCTVIVPLKSPRPSESLTIALPDASGSPEPLSSTELLPFVGGDRGRRSDAKAANATMNNAVNLVVDDLPASFLPFGQLDWWFAAADERITSKGISPCGPRK